MALQDDARTLEFYYDVSPASGFSAVERNLINMTSDIMPIRIHSIDQYTRIESLASRTGAHIIWRPVLLGAIYRATSAPQGAAGSASDVFNPTKKNIASRAFRRTLRRNGVVYNEPPRHPQKTTAALRLLYTVPHQCRPALTKALFRAYWAEGRNVSDVSVLRDCVRRSGISDQEHVLRALGDGSFESSPQRRDLEISTDLAIQRGSPGVPAFWIADEVWYDRSWNRRTGRLYWGQDRMHFVEAVLHALNEGKNGEVIADIQKGLRGLVPRCRRDGIPDGDEVKLEFWYDFSSPWAFLGWTQLSRLKREYGQRLSIEMKPFLLGILFREIGAPNTPTSVASEQKRNYSNLDHADWVRWWNAINIQDGKPDANIDFYWTDTFPIRTPTVLRASLAEPELVPVLYRACWERNLNMSDDKVLHSVITEAGYNADDILNKANSSEVKKDLRARTADAKEQGLCGVPTYRVFRRKAGSGEQWRQAGDLVWGQDDIDVVEDLIAGWDGDGVAKVDEDAERRGEKSRL